MKYAVDTMNFGLCADVRVLADMAAEAEKAGWDGFFIWDHIALPFEMEFADTTVALAAIALATERIRFGALVTPLPRRRPHKLAREMATLDHLSKGRLVVGVGLGIVPIEYEGLGEETDMKRRGQMLDEGLDVLTGLWSAEPFSYAGEHYTVKDVQFLEPPVQKPRPPVWVAATWPNRKPIRRAVKWDGLIPIPVSDDPLAVLAPGELHAIMDYVREQREDLSGFEVVMGEHTPGDDPARAAEIVTPYAEAGLTWWLEVITPIRFDPNFEQGPDFWLGKMRERIQQGPVGTA